MSSEDNITGKARGNPLQRPEAPVPVGLCRKMKPKGCYHSCKRSLLGQKSCAPAPPIPRKSLTKRWRSLKAPERLRSPTSVPARFTYRKPSDGYFKVLEDKKGLLGMSLPQQTDWVERVHLVRGTAFRLRPYRSSERRSMAQKIATLLLFFIHLLILHSPSHHHRRLGSCNQSEPNERASVNLSAGVFSHCSLA